MNTAQRTAVLYGDIVSESDEVEMVTLDEIFTEQMKCPAPDEI